MPTNYLIAIPSYNRENVITQKTLKTLSEGNIDKNKIFIFVANKTQQTIYENNVPKDLYYKIIIGKKGITNQRNFIATYFPEGQYVISLDDDIERFEILRGDKLSPFKDIEYFFMNAYKILLHKKLYIWGIYPVRNAFFMYKETTADLRFLIGVAFGFISRPNIASNKLKMSVNAETKEDYEQTILYFLHDGGVVRFNNITVKTKFNSPGGLGTDRFERNKNAAEYLHKTYPNIITVFQRKNGTHEVKLKKISIGHSP
jgi:hypothetical protein